MKQLYLFQQAATFTVIIPFSAGNWECMLHKRQAVTMYQRCHDNNDNKHFVCISDERRGSKRNSDHYNTLVKQVLF